MLGHAFLQVRIQCPHCRKLDVVMKLTARAGHVRTCGHCKKGYEITDAMLLAARTR